MSLRSTSPDGLPRTSLPLPFRNAVEGINQALRHLSTCRSSESRVLDQVIDYIVCRWKRPVDSAIVEDRIVATMVGLGHKPNNSKHAADP